MKTYTTQPVPMHRRSLLLAVAAGLASILIPASAHAALYSPALPGDALYVANSNTGNSIVKFTPGGVGSLFASTSRPAGLAFDSAGNLYASNYFSNTITKFTPGGVGSVFASSGLSAPDGLAFDSAGNLYVTNQSGNTITKFTPGGVGSVFASTGLNSPSGLAFVSAGNLYAANYSSNTIEEFSALGADLGVFASSGMHNPIGLAFGPVPEPATLAVGLLCLGAGMARRRRA